MEALQALTTQLNFSLNTSQLIISLTFAYWEYAANKAVLFQMAMANAYGIFMTMFVGLFLGFVMVYAWVLPSSK
jgi:hypothetical protein